MPTIEELDVNKVMETIASSVDKMISSVYMGVPDNDHLPLPFDMTGVAKSNRIIGEEHDLSKVFSHRFIQPKAGSFYGNSLIATYDGSVLKHGTDYIYSGAVAGTDGAVTRNGVYDYIILLNNYDGVILITYQAVGGSLPDHVKQQIHETLLRYPSKGPLDAAEDFTAMCSSPAVKEVLQLAYCQQSDKIIHHIPRNEDATVWVAMAEFGKDGHTSGQSTIEISSETYGWDYKVRLIINLADRHKIKAYSIGDTSKLGTFDSHNLSTLDRMNSDHVWLRLIWITDGSDSCGRDYCGALLQIGLNEHKCPAESLSIKVLENDGRFDFIKTTIATLENSSVELPSGELWMPSKGLSYKLLLCHDNMFTIWYGSQPLAQLHNKSRELRLCCDTTLNVIGQIKKVMVVIHDTKTKANIVTTNKHSGASDLAVGSVLFYPEDFCIFNYSILMVNGELVLNTYAVLGENSLFNNRFKLVQVALVI
jgi:hypothetical protein